MHSLSQLTNRRLPLAENECQTCPVENTNEVFTDLLEVFSPHHIQNAPYDMLIDDRVYATETFT